MKRTALSSDDIDQYAEMFGAIGTGSRLRIVRLLLAAHPAGLVVADIQSETGMAGSTLSHHLEKLRHKGLISVRRAGTYLWYSIRIDALHKLLSFLFAECCTRNRVIKPQTFISITKS